MFVDEVKAIRACVRMKKIAQRTKSDLVKLGLVAPGLEDKQEAIQGSLKKLTRLAVIFLVNEHGGSKEDSFCARFQDIVDALR